MKQVLHIFRKDIRFLRFEIAGFLLLTAVFAFQPILSDVLEVAALYVVARLIHAEAIPGDRQYWLTRPYRPSSLLGSKLLFIAVFICAPIGIAQIVLALRLGFPLVQEIPGLLWAQVLFFFAGALPVAALAAVAEGLVSFTAMVLVLIAMAFLAGTSLPASFPRYFAESPMSVAWIRSLAFGLAICITAAVVLRWQYRDRRTLFSRLFGIIAFYLATACYLWLPASVPLFAETWLSPQPALAAPVKVSLDPAKRREATSLITGRSAVYRNMRIPLPLAVEGVPAGAEARCDDLSVSFEWPDRLWKPSRKPGVTARAPENGTAVLDGIVLMDPALYSERKGTPVTIRGAAYITLFGDAEGRKISLKSGPVNVQDGLQCFSSDFEGEVAQMICRSFFRWPSRLVYAEGMGDQTDFGNSMISYSPFPAILDPNPLQVRWAEPIKADEATIVTRRPLVHFRREFELRGVRLADFEKRPELFQPAGVP